MISHLRRPGVLPAVMLVIIILWAFIAVLLLTRTLVSATQIDNRVEVINGEVGPIDEDLDSVVLAGQVAETTDQIRPAAEPLSGQLTTTNENVTTIDASAEKILVSAGMINGTAEEINATVQQINGNVNTIGSTLNSVESSATSINDSVDGINASLGGVLSEVVSIDDRAAGINQRADAVISRSRGIAANVANVTDVQVPAIIANAAAIDGSPLLLNQAAAAALVAPDPTTADQVVPLKVPDLVTLPAPVRLPAPAPEIGGILPLGGQESEQSAQAPENDSGSILGGLVGGP